MNLATTGRPVFKAPSIGGVVVAVFLLVNCSPRPSESDVYTLYRNSGADIAVSGYSAARIHIATFDATESAAYNQQNCDIARTSFKEHFGGVVLAKVNYWCEQGRYKR
jgi:hypothetical protein